jgi:hypothetical protein
MQVFFIVDVNPGGFLYQAGQSYEMDAATAQRFISQGVATLTPNTDGASPAAFLTAQAISNLTRGKARFSTDRPEASISLVGSVWQSSSDTPDPEVECNGLSWVPRPVSANSRASEEMSLERMLPLQALWVADDIVQTDGSQVAAWVDRIAGNAFVQATAGQRPLVYRTTAARLIGGRPVVTADGTDDLLHCTLNDMWPTSRGCVFAVLRDNPAGTATHAVLLSSQINTAVNTWLYFGHDNAVSTPGYVISQRNNDSEDRVTFASVVANTPQLVEWNSSGIAYSMRLNNTTLTPTVTNGANVGDWFADCTGRAGSTLFARKTNSETRFWRGDLAMLGICSRPLTPTERQARNNWIKAQYGISL